MSIIQPQRQISLNNPKIPNIDSQIQPIYRQKIEIPPKLYLKLLYAK